MKSKFSTVRVGRLTCAHASGGPFPAFSSSSLYYALFSVCVWTRAGQTAGFIVDSGGRTGERERGAGD